MPKGDTLGGAVIVDSPIRSPEEEARHPLTRPPMGNKRVYETFDTALARFRLMLEQLCDNPFIVEFIGRHSLRRAEDGWIWKFDSEAMGSRRFGEPVREYLQAVGCRAALIFGEKTGHSLREPNAAYVPAGEEMMKPVERRDFVKGAATGVLAFTVGGVEVFLTPRDARAQNVPFRLLKADEGETIEALGETLVPGARAAGIAHFIDQQLSVPPEEALLEARILNVRPPYANFYHAAIGAVDTASEALNNGRKFARLSPSEAHDFVDAMRQNKVQGWQGPGGSFVYLVLRSDAVDVVYGTVEGYEALGIPYMPHIAPEKRW